MNTELFDDTVKQDTPRLVVTVESRPDGNEVFQWGIVGTIPILSLIGGVVQAIGNITRGAHIPKCPQRAFVIAWDADNHLFQYFAHPDTISDNCVGMLDMIRATLVDTHRARSMAAQQIILGPNGTPIRG